MKTKKVLLITLIALMFIMPMILAVDEAPISAGQAGYDESWLTSSSFYSLAQIYLIPDGMSGLSGVIIGIVTMLIILVIFLDLLEIFAPFSQWANWTISIGLAIIALVIHLNVTVAGWIFKVGAIMFAWAGAAAVFLNIVLTILVLVFIFVGGQWIQRWASGVKNRRNAIRADEGVARARSGLRTLKGIGDESAA